MCVSSVSLFDKYDNVSTVELHLPLPSKSSKSPSHSPCVSTQWLIYCRLAFPVYKKYKRVKKISKSKSKHPPYASKMDDLDDILERSVGNDFYHLSDDDHERSEDRSEKNKKDEDILGLDKEIKVKTRKKLVTLNDQKLLSRDGLPYLYSHRKKLKYLTKNKSDYSPKDYTTHYTYKNLSTILEFYQLWAHKLFPKLRFVDAIYLANRKSAGESKNVRYFREKLVEQEMNELFPDETVEVSMGRDDIDAVLSDTEMNHPLDAIVADHVEDNDGDASLVPHSNGLFIGDDDDDNDLYTTSTLHATIALNQIQDSNPLVLVREDEGSDDGFGGDDMDDDDEELMNLSNKRKHTKKIVEEEFPDPQDVQDYDAEMDVMREMGL